MAAYLCRYFVSDKMNHSAISLLLCLTFLGYARLRAQTVCISPNEYLVSLDNGKDPTAFQHRIKAAFPASFLPEENNSVPFEKISKMLNIWRLRLNAPSAEMLAWLRQQPEIRLAQLNHPVENRALPTLPNDPLLAQQWQYQNDGSNGGTPNADLDADLAWSIATGGLSPAGDTIVVAVIDAGLSHTHPDLQANLWKNWAEVPDDGLDNDQNGYADDFLGWNVFAQNDDIQGFGTAHGTPVAAIVGARGDNGIGVTGVNWQVKTMFVVGGQTEADVLTAYDYVLNARRLYNATNGAAGAFVVAVNCSWGINYAQAADAPLWCAAFDSLGAAGILSVAATANLPLNVDLAGDLPTTCPSEYLLSVTSLDRNDARAFNAAWGAQHVDIGAYGKHVFTASMGSSYGTFSGTSFAAPHVSGAVALLYAAPCPDLVALSKTDPAAAAIWVKNLLLDYATPNPSMAGATTSGGRLNLHSFLKGYQDQCLECPAPFSLKINSLTENSVSLHWLETSFFQSVNLRWRAVGTTTWNTLTNVQNGCFLNGLNPCTSYEFAAQARCPDDVWSVWSSPFGFETKGCCNAPAAIWLEAPASAATWLAWENISPASAYTFRVRAEGGDWDVYEVAAPAFYLEDLLPCTRYEVSVRAVCAGESTDFSAPFFFYTEDCGVCAQADYCPSMAEQATSEWIASVQIGEWVHASSPGGNGYQDFSNGQAPLLQFLPQSVQPVLLTPGFSGLPAKEYFRIFVDFNLDGDFEDAGEMAFDAGYALEIPVGGNLVVPDFQTPGIARLRVVMKYMTPNDDSPTACEAFDFGQVEDYCVQLNMGPTRAHSTIDTLTLLNVFPQPAADWVALSPPKPADGEWDLQVWFLDGAIRLTARKPLHRDGTIRLSVAGWMPGVYVVRLRQEARFLWGKILIN
jgi:serine protease